LAGEEIATAKFSVAVLVVQAARATETKMAVERVCVAAAGARAASAVRERIDVIRPRAEVPRFIVRKAAWAVDARTVFRLPAKPADAA
jgi:2-C-methyl-D-erythritol 4-phosphate cytidylyltransferase